MSILFGLYIHITKLSPKRKLDFFLGVGCKFKNFVAVFLAFLRVLFLGYLCRSITFACLLCKRFNMSYYVHRVGHIPAHILTHKQTYSKVYVSPYKKNFVLFSFKVCIIKIIV